MSSYTAGQLMATLSLDMAPFTTSLDRAKEHARTVGAQIAMFLRVEPEMDNAGYITGMNRMVEEAKKTAARIKGELSTVHMDELSFGNGIHNADRVRLQLQSVMGDAQRLRTLIGEPLVIGGGDDARLRGELDRLQAQMDRLRRTAAEPVRMASSAASVPTNETSSNGVMSKLGGGMLRNAGYMAGSAAIFGVGAAIASTIKATASFETEINTMGAISGASAAQLGQVSQKALQLGADFTIANASASDAAVVMGELVKGGLSVKGAMDAARGALQLAAAGGVTFVQAADLETAAIAQFGLKATDAGHVADILANAAHAARGSVMELGTGLSYAGTIAHQAGYSLEQTAAVLSEFAKFGLNGSLGGTTLKDLIMRLEKAAVSTGAAGNAYKELNLNVYNANGTLKTAGQISDQLAAAHKRLAPQLYNSAMQTVFGARAITGANILASQGAKGLDVFAGKLQTLGGAQAFSTARMKGLGGSFANLKNQIETAQVSLGEKYSPAMQKFINMLADATPKVTAFFMGPSIGDGFAKLGKFFGPIISGASDLIAKAWPYISSFVGSIKSGFGSVLDFVKPVIDAIGGFFKTASANGSIDALGKILKGVGQGFEAVLKFLAPVGQLIGGAIKWFSDLGPIATTAATALIAFELLKGPLGSMLGSVVDGVKGLFNELRNVGTGAGAAAGGMNKLGKALTDGGIIAALTLIITTYGDMNKALKDAETAGRALAGGVETDLVAANGKWTDSVQKSAEAAITQTDQFKALIKNGADYGEALHMLTGGSATSAKAANDLSAAISRAADASGDPMAFRAWVKGAQRGKEEALTFAAAAIKAADDVRNANAKTAREIATTSAIAAAAFAAAAPAMAKTAGWFVTAAASAAAAFAAAAPTIAAGVNAAKTSAGGLQGIYNEIAAGAKAAASDTSAFYEVVAGAKGKPDTIITPMMVAFDNYKKSVADADTTTQMFIMPMDKLAGRNVPVEDAMRANAAAARGIGDAGRKQQADQAALQDAKDALAKAEAGHIGTQDDANRAGDKATIAADNLTNALAKLQKMQDSGGASASALAAQQAKVDQAQQAATKSADAAATATANIGKQTKGDVAYNDALAAAKLKVADANSTLAGSSDAIVAADELYQKTAAMNLTLLTEQAAGQKGFGYAVKVGTAEMGKQRQAFIDQHVALGMTADAAKKLADHYGLIPAKVQTIISGDPTLAVMAANYAQAAIDKAAHDRITKLRIDSADALKDISRYGVGLQNLPKNLTTRFAADIATAAAEGLVLYNVYNKTTGKWVAQFETPDAAAAQQTAGDLVKQYDKAQGTWTSSLVAIDLASAAINTVAASLAAVQDKTVTLTVNAAGGAVTVHPNGSFNAGHGVTGQATGGMVYGPGTGTSDSILRRLSNGEGINTARAMSHRENVAAMHFMNAGGVIPGFATGGLVGGLHVKMGEHGDFSSTLAQLHSIYGNADKSATAANAAPVAAVAPAASSAGVAQWVPLMMKVITQKLGPVAASYIEPIMAAQMQNESSGNPAAINLYDINAQQGHPSKGLLQFIDSTFNRYADPGFNTNIWDPESQMRAFLNYVPAAYGSFSYLTSIGNGPYATGGLVHGKGTGTSDSIFARISNGEGINTARAMEKPANVAAMNFMNAGGVIPGFAGGGLASGLPSMQNLEGYPGAAPPGAGPRLTEVINALMKISAVVATQDGLLVSAKAAEQKAIAAADSAALAAIVAEKKAEAKYSAAQLANAAGANAKITAAETALSRVRDRAAASELAAEQRLDAAHESRSKNRDAIVEAAQQHLAAVQLANVEKMTAAEAHLAAVRKAQHSASQVDQAAVAAAQAKVAAATDKARIAQTNYQTVLARTQAVDRAQAALQRLYQHQQTLAAQMDNLNVRLGAAQTNLQTMRDSRAASVSNIATTVSGFDGGLTGHADTRGTADTFLRGQQYDLARIVHFQRQLAALRKRGLSTDQINSLSAAGVDTASVTVNALFNGTAGQLAAANKVAAQIKGFSVLAGDTAAGAMFDPGIKLGEGLVRGILSQEKNVNRAMTKIALSALWATKKALKINSPSQVFHDEVGVMIGRGVTAGIHSQIPHVARAAGSFVTVPRVRSGGGPSMEDRIEAGIAAGLARWQLKMNTQGVIKAVREGNQLRSRLGA